MTAPFEPPDPDDLQETADSQSGSDLPARLQFLQLSEEDADRLRSLRQQFEEQGPDFAKAFYEHLFGFPETASFLQDKALVARLKESQQEHFRSLLDAEWNDQFAAERKKVGEAHARVGIQPHLFLGAYNQYLQHWLGQLGPQQGEATVGIDHLRSLVRVTLLDIGLTLDAYFDQITSEMRTALDLYWRANAELRQFAQLASHDLKTPLGTVANLCDEAVDEFGDSIPEEARELLEKARTRIFRMSATIDELLASTMHAGTGQRDVLVDMNKVIAEAADVVRPHLERAGIALTIAPTLPTVLADEPRLREVFVNLLSNAAKFIDNPHGKIDIWAATEGQQCTFFFRDNGSGIPPEDQQRVFSPFRRLRSHQHIAGSGLGLYFTRDIVNQLGGRIWVESPPGEGCCFCVALRTA